MNPEHTIPTIDDNGFILWDSHAICAYLVDKYAKDDKLYPKDVQLRATCNQRLFFEAASLFVRLNDIVLPIYFKGCHGIHQNKLDAIINSFDILEAFLAIDPFLVGSNLTIADISLGLTVPFLATYVPLSMEKFPKIVGWLNRISQTIPFYDEMHAQYPAKHRQLVYNLIEKNKQRK